MYHLIKPALDLHVPVSSGFADVKVLPLHFMRAESSPSLLSSSSFPSVSTGKVFVPKQKPIETRQDEVTTLDPELEEALSSATDTELCDLAGKKEEIPWRKQKGLKNTTLYEGICVCCAHHDCVTCTEYTVSCPYS